MQDDNQPVSSAPALGQPFTQTGDNGLPGTTATPTHSGSLTPVNPSDSANSSQLPTLTESSSTATSSDATDLDDLKQKTLKDLTPLLGQLEQPPEEKYKTLMMVIQASDKQELLKDAYETAQKISDPTARADALVGILNEINYFSKG